MSLFRRITPSAEQKLTQARRDLRDVQQQLEQLGPGSFPLGSPSGRRFAHLSSQMQNLQRTISQLGQRQQLAA